MATSNGAILKEISDLDTAYKAADAALDTAYKAADSALAGRCTALEAVAPVRVLATIPAAATANNGWVVLFIGETDGDYTQYHFYISTGSAWTDLGTFSAGT